TKEHFPFAKTDSERRTLARADQQILFVGEQEPKCECTAQLPEGCRHRFRRRLPPLHLLRDQMGNRLGIRVADEFATLLAQLFAQFAEILDDAIVNHRNEVGGMRMGIILGRAAVGGPTRVADADRAAQWLTLEPRLQSTKLAFRAPPAEHTMIERCNSR